MKEALIDTSEDHVGIVIAEGVIIKILKNELKMKFSKTVHMTKLRHGERLSVFRIFDKIFREKGFTGKTVELFSINVSINDAKFWNNLVIEIINKGIGALNVDYEVNDRLNKFVNTLLLRQLEIYYLKETLQLADIVAYANSHHNFVKNIWKNVPLEMESYQKDE